MSGYACGAFPSGPVSLSRNSRMGFSLEGVGFTHANGYRALRGIDLRVAAGERVALIGASGAGKTTAAAGAGGVLRPGDGRVRPARRRPLGGSPAGAAPALRARIGLVHQAAPIPPRQRVVTAVLAGPAGPVAAVEIPRLAGGAGRPRKAPAASWPGSIWPSGCSTAATASPAASCSGWRWPGCSTSSPICCSPTSRFRRWTRRSPNSPWPCSTKKPCRRGVTLVASLHAVDLALRHFPAGGGREGRRASCSTCRPLR
jgi:phosphonate transport system ATP-binding protein